MCNLSLKRYKCSRGFSILEVIATLAMTSVLSYVALNQLKELDDPLKNSAAELEGFIKQVRARAISTTSAYTISSSGTDKVVATYGDTCSDPTQLADPTLELEFPLGAFMSDTLWSVCYNSRGLPDDNITIGLQDESGEGRTIEVFLGGAVKQLES